MPAKGDNSRQKPTRWKPLTIEQQNAIDLLILGQTDQEVADTVGVTRPTVTEWRNQHPYFQSELQQRRAEVWRSITERLRSGLSKAVNNLLAAVEAGDLKASLELLKCCNIYGDSHMNAIHDR